ncbi:aldo/keto reductase [Asanoa siamensis]|uniref:Oxidoreductase n=1 Tax=Asanoa siamensis TaxID=926357 RepID=A0ABQ4D084_9ACTN|nr:aldo/keto reductase [Asanoa siamensis]GIF76507.1 oxidoreductase [Asanoa siamensis]
MTTDVRRPGGPGFLGGRVVSRIGYGAMQLARLRDDRAAAVTLLRRALDLGVDHLDTAQVYGNGYVNGLLRAAIDPADHAVVSTKVGIAANPGGKQPMRPAQRPAELRVGVEDNLRSLGAEQIAVVNLRRMDVGAGFPLPRDQVVDLEDQLAVLMALRDAGKIGAIGLSGVDFDGLRRAIPAGITCVQNSYSVLTRDHEDMLKLSEAEGIAWVPYYPLGGATPGVPKVTDDPVVRDTARALNVSTAQVGLAWLLRHSPNTLLIPGTSDAGHLAANVAAGDILLDDATLAALDAVAPA